MKAQRTVRMGSIGTSAIMRVIQDAASKTEGIERRAVYSRSMERGRAFADELGIPAVYDDLEKMLLADDLDLIYVASPNALHVSQAKRALETGHDVIIEKPAAVSEADIDMLHETAVSHGVFFFEAISTLFMPSYLDMKQHLPALGKISEADIRYGRYSSKYDAYLRGENPNIFNPDLKGGAVNDMGIYCIHVAVDLFGRPEGVRYEAEYGDNGVDLKGTMYLTYPKLQVKIMTSKIDDPGCGTYLACENGTVRQEGDMNNFEHCRISMDGKTIDMQEEAGVNRMIYEQARFRDALLERDTAFFEKMYRQSRTCSWILQQA